MYDQFMRHSTSRLRDDLTFEMRAYSFEKEKLVHSLAHLHNPDNLSTTLSDSSLDMSIPSSSPRRNQFFRAPNIAATVPPPASVSSMSDLSSSLLQAPEKKRKDRKEQFDKLKKEKDLLKLPVIHSASSKRSAEWDSGKFLNSKQTISGLEPLPGITAAKELLTESMKIPSIYDPQRTDTHFDTGRGKKSTKKVTFADDHHRLLLSINQIESNDTGKKVKDSKNSVGKGPVPRLNLAANQFSHVSKPKRPKKTSLLPPLQVSPSEVRQNPQKITNGVNQWKSIYSTLVDPEDKMKALTDIMYAVRVKKYENEQSMKYGDGPRPIETDEMIKQFLSMNSLDKIAYKDENGHTKHGCIPTPRSSSVSRLGAGHPNTLQLQNYLRQMSRSRRVLDRIHSQHYNTGRDTTEYNTSGDTTEYSTGRETPDYSTGRDTTGHETIAYSTGRDTIQTNSARSIEVSG